MHKNFNTCYRLNNYAPQEIKYHLSKFNCRQYKTVNHMHPSNTWKISKTNYRFYYLQANKGTLTIRNFTFKATIKHN